MKFTTTQTAKTEIEIPIPSFYRDTLCSESITDLIGILDENTIIKVFESTRRTCVQNMDIYLGESDIVSAHIHWQPITEDVFLYHHSRALHSMSLTPELTTVTNNKNDSFTT